MLAHVGLSGAHVGAFVMKRGNFYGLFNSGVPKITKVGPGELQADPKDVQICFSTVFL